MYRFRVLITMAVALAPAGLVRGQSAQVAQADFLAQNSAQNSAQNDASRRSETLYARGESAIDARRWDRAVEAFGEAAAANGPRADGALYWKAYALNKLGRREEALTTIGQLRQAYASSRWLDDAKALEMEVHQASGQKVNPDAEPDEDLKLMAINSLMNSNPEQALPILEKFLHGNQSPKLKERALFVLAQSGSPKAHEVLAQVARGNSNPDLQMKAINYLGIMGSKENRQILSDLYASSNDNNVRRSILHSFMVSGDREHLLQAAKSEKNPDLRMEAIHQLGISGGQAELLQLYQAEPSIEVKETILHSMFIGGNTDKLIDVARTEKEVRLRKAAIHSLGLMGGEHTGAALVSMYGSESDTALRGEIINALFIQGNAKALVDLARKETNLEMKKAIVSKLSVMGSKEGADYMMELLSK
jgi:HEAT repeat protein